MELRNINNMRTQKPWFLWRKAGEVNGAQA